MSFMAPVKLFVPWRASASIALVTAALGLGIILQSRNATSSAQQDRRYERWKVGAVAEAIKPLRRAKKGEPFPVESTNPETLRKAGVSTAQARNRRADLDKYLAVNVEFKDSSARLSFRQTGATVFNAIDRFADVFIPEAQFERVLDAIAKRTDVIWLEPIGLVGAPPKPRPRQIPPTRQVAEQIVRGGLNGVTGRGVVIAIIDSGVDFRNPDFVTYDTSGRPTSRLLYLWDTTSNAFDSSGLGSKPTISYPNGASIGTLYTRDELTAELRSSSKRIPATDLNGHGTACAGIAAGNGNNDRGQNGTKRTNVRRPREFFPQVCS
jgi:subtilisin family serine protease